MRKPRRLEPGATVGVVAPSGPIVEERLALGVAALEAMGLRPLVGAHARDRAGYLAGDDAVRRADLQRICNDPAVRAVWCARGGYGSQRIIPSLDWGWVEADPKPLIGFSDVTALVSATVRQGLVAFHGPMAAADVARGLTPRSSAWLWSVLSDPDFRWEAEVPMVLRAGRAEGPLVGGCLSVLATLLGTAWAPPTDGAILFLEDTNEPPYRLDRLLTQLDQAGCFARVAGVVCGTFATCRVQDGITPLDVVRRFFADAPFPVGFGLMAGHSPAPTAVENWTLPMGVTVRVTLDDGHGRLLATEGAVR